MPISLKEYRTNQSELDKSTPAISVIVCTYNGEKVLPDCLISLANQNIDKRLYEVIVVDNNSNDNTQKVVKEIMQEHSNFRLLFKREQGLGHARNLGFNRAKAEYVAYIDDDARTPQDWLEKSLRIIEEKKPDIFGGPAYPLFSNGKPDWFKSEYGIRGDMGETGWLEKGFIVGTNIFFKKSLLEQYGGFDPDLGMKGGDIGYHEETRIVFRAFKEKKKVYYSKELAVKDLLPEYKKSLAFFMYSKYRAGTDGLKLWEPEFELPELLNLLTLIDNTMSEFHFALLKRDIDLFEYPENYIVEKLVNNFFEIGQRIGYFLKEDNLIEKLSGSLFKTDSLDKIAEKVVDNNRTFETIRTLIYHKLRRAKLFGWF